MAKNDLPYVPAEPAELPTTMYHRASKPNPREADVEAAAGVPGSWFRVVEADEEAARKTAQLVRRAGKQMNVKVSVKLPKTEPGSVYFSVKTG